MIDGFYNIKTVIFPCITVRLLCIVYNTIWINVTWLWPGSDWPIFYFIAFIYFISLFTAPFVFRLIRFDWTTEFSLFKLANIDSIVFNSIWHLWTTYNVFIHVLNPVCVCVCLFVPETSGSASACVCVCGGVTRSPFYWLRNSKMTHLITDKTMTLQPLISHTLPDIYMKSQHSVWLAFSPSSDCACEVFNPDLKLHPQVMMLISHQVSIWIFPFQSVFISDVHLQCSTIDMAQTFFWYFFFSSRFRPNCLNKQLCCGFHYLFLLL